MAVPMPPGGPMEIVLSFDTTGSMSSYLDEVRQTVTEITERLFADIPSLRMSIFAHGDYCDATTSYVTKNTELTNDVKSLCEFVKTVGSTGGGDTPECYELVLRQVRELDWNADSQRALVMIGDAPPHEKSYPQNKLRIDWKQEVKCLQEEGVRIYGVQCGHGDKQTTNFFSHMSDKTGGKHLRLGEISSIVELLMAVCYREQGPDFYMAYEKEVRARKGMAMRPDMDGFLVALRDGKPSPGTAKASGLSSASLKRGAAKLPKGGAKRLVKTTAPSSRKRKSSEGSDSDVSSSTASTRSHSGTHEMALRPTPVKHICFGSRKPMKAVKSKSKRQARENLKASLSQPADLTWSRWQLGMAKTVAATANGDWGSFRGEFLRNRALFQTDADKPAVYEVAIQTPSADKKHAVYHKVSPHGFNAEKRTWEKHILGGGKMRTQAERTLRRGCKLYVRRALVEDRDETAVKELRKLMTKTYDYAWNQRFNPKTHKYTSRPVKKNCIPISLTSV